MYSRTGVPAFQTLNMHQLSRLHNLIMIRKGKYLPVTGQE